MHKSPSSTVNLQPIIHALNTGALERGETLARKLLRKFPRHAELRHLCAVACLMRGKAAEAERLFEQALELREDAAYYLNLALARQQLGKEVAAEHALRNCLRLQPGHAQANNNLGNILNRQRRYAEAEQCYRTAIAGNPGYMLAYKNLGSVLREQGRSEEAIPVLRQAIELAPQASEPRAELAGALEKRGRHSDAAEQLKRIGHWGDLQRVLRCLGDWRELEAVDTRLLQQFHDDPTQHPIPWGLINLPRLSASQHREAGFRFATHAWARELASPPLAGEPLPGERLRIGYLSSDFYDHATLHLLMGVLEAHDRDRVDVQLFDHSPRRDDPFTRRLVASGLPRHDLGELSDRAAAQRIAEQHLHILVDLKGYTTGARLGICALRPAPVIVSWLGYPGSLGHPRLADYLIGDPTVTPAEHAKHFSETLALLPHCYQPNDRNRPLGNTPNRAEAGLPENSLVFCSFNQLLKLNPEEFDRWCHLLREVPGSVLWLLDPESPEACANLRREAQQRGVAAERLIFAPRLTQPEHLARLPLADLALDSFPCTSHTTASDALWAGVPLVTRLGETFASRVAGSLLRAHGFDELLCADAEGCFRLALRLAQDSPARLDLRERLAAARLHSPLFDTRRFAGDLEALYRAIWQRHLDAPHDRSPLRV